MSQAKGGYRVEFVCREQIFPLIRDEGSINALKRGMSPFITPLEQLTIEVDFLKCGLVDESSKLPHQPYVHTTIILVFRSVHHVKVTVD
jgi:hypothetical protein